MPRFVSGHRAHWLETLGIEISATRRPASQLVLGSVYAANTEPSAKPAIGGRLTLASARRLVAELRHEIAQGRDPAAIHFAEKHRRTEKAGDTARRPPRATSSNSTQAKKVQALAAN